MELENCSNSKHIVKYNKTKAYVYLLIAAISLIAGVILIKSTGGIVLLALTLSFTILMVVEITRFNKLGSFESMDVVDNRIIYYSYTLNLIIFRRYS